MTAVIGATAVHPRMRARRIAVERDRGRRRMKWLVVAAVVLALGAGITVFLQSSWMDVDSVEITGIDRTPLETVQEAAGIAPGTSLLGLELAEARRAIAELPWVDEVHASADWRGRVLIEVSERQPVAQVQTPDGYSVVDAEGRVVTFTADAYPGLAVISGLGGAGAGGWLGAEALEPIAVAAAIGPDLQAHISSVSAEPGGEVFLELNRGGRVRMGDSRDLEAKVLAIRTLIQQVEMGCVGLIDVRAATAPVITRSC